MPMNAICSRDMYLGCLLGSRQGSKQTEDHLLCYLLIDLEILILSPEFAEEYKEKK